jgi:hypothetical protein
VKSVSCYADAARDREEAAVAGRSRGDGLCETDGLREIPWTVFSPSDNARSCLRICAFSCRSTFLGLAAFAFAIIADTTMKEAMPTATMIHGVLSISSKRRSGRIVRLRKSQEIGYEGRCP